MSSRVRETASQLAGDSSRRSLDVCFAPKSVAVVGATESAGSVGRTLLWNLLSSQFGGTVFPVNPKRSSVLGIKAYSTVNTIPEPVDLAVVVTPAATAPRVIRECAEASVKDAVIISAGFKEGGLVARSSNAKQSSKRGGAKCVFIGPNCLA
jgi:acetyltransferase